MFGYSDIDRTIQLMEQLRRRMDRAYDDPENRGLYGDLGTFPRTNLYDSGKGYRVEMEVPGLSDNDVSITLTQDVLSVSGERKAIPFTAKSELRSNFHEVTSCRRGSTPISARPR